ncbi:DNA helicase [Rhizobium sp. TRM95796]|uniref:DNA helicase n=1 Tax=Rhizobium sp. TRM95796 TaxID=2979862 RepID=UPI0021E864D1|nr:DNA helicase [Rhizobium sp. TRM95796]MCV3766941.1 DNA helicase [Rhizobium sp. TRM95796]
MTYPIYLLKRQARRLSRAKNIPLHDALDQIARREGFQAWSHLSSAITRQADPEPNLVSAPGGLLLIGARPGQGKTVTGLIWAADAVRSGHRASIFSLEETEPAIQARLLRLDRRDVVTSDRLQIDLTDGLDADHIISRLGAAQPGDIAIVDYLQLLDQNRRSPPLRDQVTRLRALAQEKRMRIACLSQIDRRFELSGKSLPDYTDVRRADALGANLFDKAYFLHKGRTGLVALSTSG